MVKEFLSQYGVSFTVKNVATDAAARREFEATGALLPPVTVIHGVAVAGFQPEALLRLLEAPTTSPEPGQDASGRAARVMREQAETS